MKKQCYHNVAATAALRQLHQIVAPGLPVTHSLPRSTPDSLPLFTLRFTLIVIPALHFSAPPRARAHRSGGKLVSIFKKEKNLKGENNRKQSL